MNTSSVFRLPGCGMKSCTAAFVPISFCIRPRFLEVDFSTYVDERTQKIPIRVPRMNSLCIFYVSPCWIQASPFALQFKAGTMAGNSPALRRIECNNIDGDIKGDSTSGTLLGEMAHAGVKEFKLHFPLDWQESPTGAICHIFGPVGPNSPPCMFSSDLDIQTVTQPTTR